MTVAKPDIQDIVVDDVEEGVILFFRLDEGLEETESLGLNVRARIRGSDYYQPLFLNILSGGKSASATIEPGKVQVDELGVVYDPWVDLQFYMEAYPSREKSEIVTAQPSFKPDWFYLPAHEHEVRSEFERTGVEMQAAEACRFRLVYEEEKQEFPEAALDSGVGLWVVVKQEETIGIAPDQPDFGYAWRKAWFPQVLKRSRELRMEYGWDDGENH